MIIDLFDLNINGKKINIDGEVNIPLELLNDSSIRRLDNVYFQGYINKLIELCGEDKEIFKDMTSSGTV